MPPKKTTAKADETVEVLAEADETVVLDGDFVPAHPLTEGPDGDVSAVVRDPLHFDLPPAPKPDGRKTTVRVSTSWECHGLAVVTDDGHGLVVTPEGIDVALAHLDAVRAAADACSVHLYED